MNLKNGTWGILDISCVTDYYHCPYAKARFYCEPHGPGP
jgi:hypothetical protein